MAWSPIFEVALNTLPGVEPGALDWTDFSSRLRIPEPIEISYGPARLVGNGEGDLSLTLDAYDRTIDPTNPISTTDPLVRHARLRVLVGATTFDLFRGLVDEWQPMWDPVDSLISVRLVDWFTVAALQDSDLDLPRQMSHERINALLDLAGVPAALRDIGAGVVEVEPFEQSSANLYRTMRDTADAEGGELYIAPDGKITFRSRHQGFAVAPSVTFGGPGGVPYTGPQPTHDTSAITNVGRVELADGDVYEAIDDGSVLRFTTRVLPVRDLSLRSAEAEAVAQWEVVRFAWPQLWLDGMEVDATDDDVLATLLPLRISDLAQVLYSPIEGGAVDVTMSLGRIKHTIEPGLWTWHADLTPWFGQGAWLTLDDDVLGLLDGDNKLAP